MAVRSFTAEHVGPGIVRIVWSGLTKATDDTGAPYSDYYTDGKIVQVEGTFGTGGSVSIQSTLEATPTNYRTINDPQGNALTFTSARIEAVQEPNGVIRPAVTAGDNDTNLTVTLITVVRPKQ